RRGGRKHGLYPLHAHRTEPLGRHPPGLIALASRVYSAHKYDNHAHNYDAEQEPAMSVSPLSHLLRRLRLEDPVSLVLAASAIAEDTVFPPTIAHAFGSTTIDGVPQRIAVAGLIEHDTLLALGIKPVAIRGWFTDYPNATGPWAQHLWEGFEPVSVAGEG